MARAQVPAVRPQAAPEPERQREPAQVPGPAQVPELAAFYAEVWE